MTLTFSTEEISLLLHWIREREAVRQAKETNRSKPWTSDPLLQNYRFCNVRRMDDKVSRELLLNWYPNTIGYDSLPAATLARLVNWPDSLFEITSGCPYSPDAIPLARSVLHRRAERGDKVFTGAYVVPGVPGLDKVSSVLNLVELVDTRKSDLWKPTMQGTWTELIALPGLASFLAGQIVADIAELPAGQEWTDRHHWAPMGPGSKRGMNRLLGRPKEQTMKQLDFEQLLPELMSHIHPNIEAIWSDRKLIAMDVQNCLCEFDKLRRLQLGEGKVRARYDGAGAPRSEEQAQLFV